MREQARVFYEGLKGITEVHEEGRGQSSRMHSTGYLAFRAIIEAEVDFTSLFEWLIEYKCERCPDLIYESDWKHYDIVRAALSESGYLPR